MLQVDQFSKLGGYSSRKKIALKTPENLVFIKVKSGGRKKYTSALLQRNACVCERVREREVRTYKYLRVVMFPKNFGIGPENRFIEMDLQ